MTLPMATQPAPKARANQYAVDHGTRPLDAQAMSFEWAASTGRPSYGDRPTRLQAGFNDIYDLFFYIEGDRSSWPKNVWYRGRMLMPADVMLNEFASVEEFTAWMDYALAAREQGK